MRRDVPCRPHRAAVGARDRATVATAGGRRLPPDEWFPAGVAGITVRRVALPDGISLRVCEAGPSDGPPLLLLHGWGATAYLWHRNILPLADAGARVIVPDLPGHGLSDAPQGAGEYTLDRFVTRIRSLLDLLGVARAIVAAQSMAGKAALQLALESPERFRSLLLFGAVGFGRVPVWQSLARFAPPLPGSLASSVVPRWAVSLVQWRVRGLITRATREDVDAVWAASQFPDVVRAQLRMAVEFDWAEWDATLLARVRVPVQVVFGTRDRTVRPRRAAVLAAAIPAARFTWIPDGGHVVMEEVPDVVNAMLRTALGGPG